MCKKLKMFLMLVSCSCFLISCGTTTVVDSTSTEVSSSSGYSGSSEEVKSNVEVDRDEDVESSEDGVLVKLSKQEVENANWVYSESQPYYYHANTKVVYFRIGDYYYEVKTAEGTNYVWSENSNLFVGVSNSLK